MLFMESAFAYLNGFILILVKTWFESADYLKLFAFTDSGKRHVFLARYCRVKRQLAFGAAGAIHGYATSHVYVTDTALRGWGAALLPSPPFH